MTLYVFALNTPVSVTLTELTRARGETAGLPPLDPRHAANREINTTKGVMV